MIIKFAHLTPLVTADGAHQAEAKEFVEWVLFHATVSKHENVVQVMYCQTKRLPMYLVLDACSPGNLLHFLWTLRNVILTHSLCLNLNLCQIIHAIHNARKHFA